MLNIFLEILQFMLFMINLNLRQTNTFVNNFLLIVYGNKKALAK